MKRENMKIGNNEYWGAYENEIESTSDSETGSDDNKNKVVNK